MKQQRLSNIELLRIACMVFIMAGHANYLVYGSPSKIDILTSPYLTSFRIFAYQLGVVAVNCFVFISGWFAINSNFKKGGNLIIQSLEYGLGLSILFMLLKYPVPKEQLVRMFFIGEYYWFIIAYLQLYILAPVLNQFSENASPKLFKSVIASFLIFEFFYGWIGGVGNYADGYSGIHFVGLYLLARYIKKYIEFDKITLPKSLTLYVAPVIVSFAIIILGGDFSEKWAYTTMRYMQAYNSPFIILSSIGLFFVFYNMCFSSKWINWMSTSVLAIYLIHMNKSFFEYVFTPLIIYCGSNILLVSVVILTICLFCILVDKLKCLIEQSILRLFNYNKNRL